MEALPLWLEQRLISLKIEVIFLFGDCRPVHIAAHSVATQLGLELGVFEEGYVRPDYVTLEQHGVNGNSRIAKLPRAYQGPIPSLPDRQKISMPYWHMASYGFAYFVAGSLGGFFFRHYKHHRPLTVTEVFPWLRSIWRKQWFKFKERGLQELLTTQLSKSYVFVPLQVYNDAQVTVHANVGGVDGFIESVLRSFARFAPQNLLLVLKHHPMDRGYRDYTRQIDRLSNELGVTARVLYVHDLFTPALLDHAMGVVAINSTVGFAALAHGAPTKVCGTAMYDMPGLTFQGSLDDFWVSGLSQPPDRDLYTRFKQHLIAQTQLNGNFYRPLNTPNTKTGLIWNKHDLSKIKAQVGEDERFRSGCDR
jgi:capsular polysaccharide export protein